MRKEIREEMQQALMNCLYNQNVNKEDIREILETTREQFDLDLIFVSTNQRYKYIMDHIFTVYRPGIEIPIFDHLPLSKAQYDEALEDYADNLVLEKPVSALEGKVTSSLLHCGLIRGGVHYGTIGFRSLKPRVWSDEEREELKVLSQLMLMYIGLINLDNWQTRQGQLMNAKIKENTMDCLYVDLITGNTHFEKASPAAMKKMPEWMKYKEFLDTYTDYFVDPVYGARLKREFCREAIQKSLGSGEPAKSMEYPSRTGDKSRWVRLAAHTMGVGETGQLESFVITIDDITEERQKNAYYTQVENAHREHFISIISIDLDTQQYGVIVDNREDNNGSGSVGKTGDYEELFAQMSQESINEDCREEFALKFSMDNMRNHFARTAEKLVGEFSYTIEDATYWVRFTAIPSNRFDREDRNVLLYFSDITHARRQEQEVQKINEVLRIEHEEKRKTEEQLLIDHLTGVYNRRGFEHITEELADEKNLGFMILDIDYFKKINDNYGHDYGDEVLAKVAEQLKKNFGSKDSVCRLGGDEFVVILRGDLRNSWKDLQKKIERIHRKLNSSRSTKNEITLSAGYCITAEGYGENLYKLADEALYYTKNNGRAGLTQIDDNHKIIHHWSDEKNRTGRSSKNIAQYGNWRVEYPAEAGAGIKPRLFWDEAARNVLGISEKLTPEENYERWHENILPEYVDSIKAQLADLKKMGSSECVYRWKHKEKGEIILRTGGRLVKNGNVMEIEGYYQSLQDTSIVLKAEDSRTLVRALSRVFFLTCYISLQTEEYYMFRDSNLEKSFNFSGGTITDVLEDLNEGFVHPDYLEQMDDFVDIETLSSRMKNAEYIDAEFLSLTSRGWCCASFMPAEWDEDGNLTHVLYVIESIDSVKKKALEEERIAREKILLQSRVNEVVSRSKVLSVALIDSKTEMIEIWKDGFFGEDSASVTAASVKEMERKYVADVDLLRFDRELDISYIKKQVEDMGQYTVALKMHDNKGNDSAIVHYYERYDQDPGKILSIIEDVTEMVPEGVGWMQQFEIMENMNEAIAIYDYESYNVVYINKTGRDILGMSLSELGNRKCYELLGDGNAPCAYCSHLLPENEKSGYMFRKVKGMEETSFVHGSIIEINGRKYRIEQGVPASRIDTSIERLQSQLMAEQQLFACLVEMLNIADNVEAIEYLLTQIVEYYDCDRAVLSLLKSEECGVGLMEICGNSDIKIFKLGQDIKLFDIFNWEEVYSPINISKAYCDRSNAEWMKATGLDNMMLMAFDYGGGKQGFIAIDNVRKHEDDSGRMGILTFFITGRLRDMKENGQLEKYIEELRENN